MTKLKHFWKFVLRKKLWFTAGAILVVGGGVFAAIGGSNASETVLPKSGDIVRSVRIAGKAVPREKVDLAFEISGTVQSVPKKVGDQVGRGQVLVQLQAGGISADLQKASAELASAQAEYAKLEGTASFETSVTSAKRSVAQTMRDAYTASSDAVQNKVDQLFINPLSSRPEIKGNFDSFNDLRESVNSGRVSIGYMLEDWQKIISKLSGDSYTETELNLSKEYLAKTTTFVSNVAQLVNVFKETSYMSQSTIDQYKADMLSARQSLNNANQGFIDVEKGLSSTLSDVPVELARVEAARATVANLRYELGKTTLIAPISGVVSRQDAKVGQAISGSTVVTTIISPDYLVETYVPEVSIAGVKVGDSASVTFDAYGPEVIFNASVESVDPAETVRDGVSTYKVTLTFASTDPRVRSGLTANVSIETFRAPASLIIPERAIVRENGEVFVYVFEGEKSKKFPISLGERDSQGNIEVLSGLSQSDAVILNPFGN